MKLTNAVNKKDLLTGRCPDDYVLIEMFGSNEQIGSNVAECFIHKLEAEPPKDYTELAHRIVEFAEDLHEEQNSYSNISPQGGLDIDVEGIDTISIRTAKVLVKDEDDINILIPEVIAMLKTQEFELSDFEDICKDYNYYTEKVKSVKDEYAEWLKSSKELSEAPIVRIKDSFGNNEYIQIFDETELNQCVKTCEMYLESHKEKFEEAQRYIEYAKDKLDAIDELKDNYLKNAEMSVEDDFNSIDGIINNGKKDDVVQTAAEKNFEQVGTATISKKSLKTTADKLKSNPPKKEKEHHNRVEQSL